MKVLGILSQKGGVGKTTMATCLAVAAEQDGQRTVIIDLDPQATACFWSDVRREAKLPDRPVVEETVPVRLSARLKQHQRSGVDLVILDGAAVARDVTTQATAVCDFVLVPTKSNAFDLAGMTHTLEVVKQQAKRGGVLLTFVAPQGRENDDAKSVVKQLGAAVCQFTIGNRKAYFRAQSGGMAVQEFEPGSIAAREVANLYRYIKVQLED